MTIAAPNPDLALSLFVCVNVFDLFRGQPNPFQHVLLNFQRLSVLYLLLNGKMPAGHP